MFQEDDADEALKQDIAEKPMTIQQLYDENDGLKMRLEAYEAKINALEKRLQIVSGAHQVAKYKAEATKELLVELLHMAQDANEIGTDDLETGEFEKIQKAMSGTKR